MRFMWTTTFIYMDESERYKLGNSKTMRKQPQPVRESLINLLNKYTKKRMSFKELYGGYIGFGKTLSSFLAIKHAFLSVGLFTNKIVDNFGEK